MDRVWLELIEFGLYPHLLGGILATLKVGRGHSGHIFGYSGPPHLFLTPLHVISKIQRYLYEINEIRGVLEPEESLLEPLITYDMEKARRNMMIISSDSDSEVFEGPDLSLPNKDFEKNQLNVNLLV